jgi:RNase P/RNase MRP subunit POP5
MSVCRKLKNYQVVVANLCNNKNFTSKLVKVSVKNVSGELKRFERAYLLINFTTNGMEYL